jgi:hypothetical protein
MSEINDNGIEINKSKQYFKEIYDYLINKIQKRVEYFHQKSIVHYSNIGRGAFLFFISNIENAYKTREDIALSYSRYNKMPFLNDKNLINLLNTYNPKIEFIIIISGIKDLYNSRCYTQYCRVSCINDLLSQDNQIKLRNFNYNNNCCSSDSSDIDSSDNDDVNNSDGHVNNKKGPILIINVCKYCNDITKDPVNCFKCGEIYCSKKCRYLDLTKKDHAKICEIKKNLIKYNMKSNNISENKASYLLESIISNISNNISIKNMGLTFNSVLNDESNDLSSNSSSECNSLTCSPRYETGNLTPKTIEIPKIQLNKINSLTTSPRIMNSPRMRAKLNSNSTPVSPNTKIDKILLSSQLNVYTFSK